MAQYAYVVARNTRAGIQLEIDKAHAEGGGLVFLPRGHYRLDGPLRLLSNVHLTGVGQRTVLEIDPALGPSAVDVNAIELVGGDEDAPHDIEVSKLVIRGPGTSPNIEADVSSEFKLGCGIVATQTTVRDVVVRGCRIENVSGCGLLFFTQQPDQLMAGITVRDCYFLQNRRPPETRNVGLYKDVLFYGSHFETIRIEGNVCVFEPNASSPYGNDSGITFVGNGRGGYVRHSRLVGNRCTGHRRHGLITNYGKMAADGVFVSDNRCENNGWVGVYVNTDYTYTKEGRVVVSGNYCCHNGFGDIGSADATIRGGIVLNGAYHGVVSGNICMNNGEPGPAFVAQDVPVGAAAVHASGINVRGAEHIVDGNLVKGNKNHGIALWPGQVSRVSMTNNRAVQNGRHGLLVAGAHGEDAQQVIVTGNVCVGNGENGLRSFLTDGALVASNYIDENVKADIELDRNTKRIQLEGSFVEEIVGQPVEEKTVEAVKPRRLKRW